MRSLALLWSSAGFATALVAAPASCGGPAFEVVPDASTSGSTPDASLDRTPGDTGVEGAPPDGSYAPESGADAATGGIIYVSPTGNDVRTGLLRTEPKRTIGSALAEAATHPGAFTVEVCAGMYSEARLTIGSDVILLGGYDCKTWTRTTTYGYPVFDGKNATTITNAEPASASYTLQVSGTATSATVIDGFAIAGGATTGVSSGLVVAAGTPVVRNDEIAGGSGQGGTTSIGSHGVIVEGAAAPEITACVIDGGSGTGSQGSVGVYLGTTGAVNLHDALVIGGTGTSTVSNNESAVGIEIRSSLADAQPLTGLIVSATDKTGAPGSVAGIYVAGLGAATPVSAGILGCYVSGGTSTSAHGVSAGILVNDPGGTVTIAADHVYGGAALTTPASTYGILVRAAGTLTVADSIVHAGTVSPAAGDSAIGVDLTAVASPSIVFDTIYTGAASGAAVALSAGVSNAVVTDDLLLGSDASLGTYGVTASQCSATLTTLDHTAFANLADLYRCNPGDGGAIVAAADYLTLQLELGKSVTTGDVVLQSACGTLAAGCAPVSGCPQTGTGCLVAVFGDSWSATDDGVCSLFGLCPADAGVAADGWTLAPGSPCAITTGGVPIANLTSDAYGKTRSATTPTMGAAEYAQTAACK